MKRIHRGFTLIELMIVVALIGILTSLALPAFQKFQCKAKQTEPKEILKAVYIVEEAYNAEHGTFLDLAALTGFGGMDPTTIQKTTYYNVAVVVTSAAGVGFEATMVDTKQPITIGEPCTDTWNVDNLTNHPTLNC